MISNSILKISKLASKKIRAERIALHLTQEEFSNFIEIKYATYKNFEQKGKISFENFIQILIKLKKEELFLEFLDGFEFNEQKERSSSNKNANNENTIKSSYLNPIIKIEQKQIILDKELFGEELFYSVENGHIYEIPNFINIILSAWDKKRLMLLIKYFGIERIKPYIVKQKDINLLKSFNQHVKYLIRKQ
ncbi:transcriptional regulator, XRE family [Arcobacter acticola]|jgi:transcriptional regulator with XRE-family HTH domain|uniref:Transcriptional regulator, XRE family n=1 Tax=Arcobacter acticola TaxID=1849015 RepID=A0A6M8EF38_9BACT|nr:helix-turn-helix transcriptional regulator [Arcobacter acticola]QKE28592.1 transcriptional regulator, XRE family [Arcobacter acticola]